MSTYKKTTIAAIATAPGQGAIALIRISGPEAREAAGAVFRGKDSSSWKPREQNFGRIVEETGDVIDEVLLTYFPAPNSFTGEEVVEIATHGGVVVTSLVLRRVLSQKVVAAEPGEFSQRAFLNGRMDLTQAEAIMDLISAQTELAAKAATEQLEGRLGDELQRIREEMISLVAHVEAYIDFPEEDISPESTELLRKRAAEILHGLDQLLATADQGQILREGLRTVICGAPNAGKSSLLNVLLGFDRAIVNETAGTTRDTIEEVINLNGIPVRLIDTAGIRDDPGEIEKEGIARSLHQMKAAELILFVIDAHEPKEAADVISFPEDSQVLPVLNKSDLPEHEDWKGEDGIRFSCHASDAAATIREEVFRYISRTRGLDTANLTAINRRHQACLQHAKDELEDAIDLLKAGESPEFVAQTLRASLEAVGDVIGKTDIEEILGEIFSTFCIGK